MISVENKQGVLILLEQYGNGYFDGEDVEQLVKEIDSKLLEFNLSYDKYNGAINQAVANVIIDLQRLTNRTAALVLYGTTNSKVLNNEEKEAFELEFTVSNNCTSIVSSLIDKFDQLPEEHKIVAYIILAVLALGLTLPNRYFAHREKMQEKSLTHEENMQKIGLEHEAKLQEKVLLHDREMRQTEIISKAIDKLAEQTDQKALDIIEDADKSLLTNLPKIDNEITLSGVKYNSQELKEIKKAKYPKEPKGEIAMEPFEGVYLIKAIDLTDRKVTALDAETSKKYSFEWENNEELANNITSVKIALQKAIDGLDGEAKTFLIKGKHVYRQDDKESGYWFIEYIEEISDL